MAESTATTFTTEDYDRVSSQFRDSGSDEEMTKVIGENKDLIAWSNAKDRKLARVGMPIWKKLTSWLSDNRYADKGVMYKDTVVGGVVVYLTYKGVRWGFSAIRGLFS